MLGTGLPLTAFKECDLRGAFESEITEELAYRFGQAVGRRAPDGKVVIGGDFRLSTPILLEALKRGLMQSGCHVVDLGQLSTPAYYFARQHLNILAGVMVTASHSPAPWNGFKPILGEYPITPGELEAIKAEVAAWDFPHKRGSSEQVNIKSAYVAWLKKRFEGLGSKLRRVIFDCGAGATGWVMQEVVDALQLPALILLGKPDGNFPQRSPDIAGREDLAMLQARVQVGGAQVGFGFDGDGDRVGVVDENGGRISSDQLIAWLAEQLLKRAGSGAVIYDLKLSRLVAETTLTWGGQAIPQKSGHTFIKTAMLEHNALLGGEYSGHLFYRELHGGDDGLYSALLVAELLAETGLTMSQAVAHLPLYPSTPDVRIRYSGEKTSLIERAADHAAKDGAALSRVDGVRAEYPNGWALMRASVTEPALTFRFEGSTPADMVEVARRFLAGVADINESVLAQVMKYA